MPYLDSLMQKTKASGQQAPEAPPKDDEENEEKKILVEQYGDVRIYRQPGEPLYLYEIPSPHYKGEEKELINALMDIAIGVMTADAAVLQPEERRKKYFERIMDIIDQTPELKVPVNAKEFYANAVVRDMVGYGIIDPMTRDEWLEEIMVIGPNRPVYVYHRKYDIMKTNVMFYDDRDIRDLVDRIARGIGRRIDTQVPILDARLKDGTRVNATIPPISLDGSTLTLRKFRKDPMSIVDMINYGTISFEAAAFMWLATDGMGVRPANTLVAGGTASGKTTTLNILSSFIPNTERIISIEDTAELSLPLKHWIRFEVRPPSMEGTGEIDMNELVKNSLRMRPDRILVGEIRGAEGYTMFAAMNTGHSGCLGTVHSNSARETIVRLANPPISVPQIMLTSLNFILMQNRIHDRRKGMIRRITELAEVVPGDEGQIELQNLYEWDPVKDALVRTDAASAYLQLLQKYTGLDRKALQQEIDEREAVLRQLVKAGTNKLDAVCEATQNYIIKKRTRL